MHLSRRNWLALSAGAGCATCLKGAGLQNPASPVPAPPRGQGDADDPLNAPARSPAKAILEKNQKDIKRDVEKLYELASQLKEEVEKTDATAVLSLAMVKKAEEIEKLARQVKDHAKG
jgi:hypothetical protein